MKKREFIGVMFECCNVYSRVYINVEGREPEGIVSRMDYPAVREALKRALEAIPDHKGRPIPTKVYFPEEIYSGPYVENAPDLLVHFGDLYWRASQDIGHEGIHSFETEIGPDDATHAQHGILVMANGTVKGGKRLEGLHLVDVAPTVYTLLGMEIPPGLEGKAIDAAGGSRARREGNR